MKIFLTLLILISSVSFAQADDMQARLEAARAYEKVTPVTELMDNMVAEIRKSPQFDANPKLLDVMFNAMDKKGMRENVINLMAKNFTVSELNSLTEFYSSEDGRNIMKKMPVYMAEAMPLIQAEVQKGIIAVQQEMAKAK